MDIQMMFPSFFRNPISAQILPWILANDEMSIDQATIIFAPFRNRQRMEEFKLIKFDYNPYKLKEINANTDEAWHMENQFNQNIIHRVRDECIDMLADLETPTKNIVQMNVQRKINNILFQIKNAAIEMREQRDFEPKTIYLKRMIQKIMEVMSKEYEQEIVQMIIAYGGLEPALHNPIFRTDLTFKQRFKQIIYNCRTFNQLKQHGGRDIQEMGSKLLQSLSNTLIKLRFNEDAAEEICDKLLDEPLSNIVASMNNLTNRQKGLYYSSDFYRNGQLLEYAQTLYYKESLDYKAKEDVTRILEWLEQSTRLQKQIIDKVLDFNLYDLLSIRSIRHLKGTLCKLIMDECPAFLKAFIMVKYGGDYPHSIRKNQRLNQKMRLANIFLRIKLPFEEWEKAQFYILSRQYEVIDDLTLKYQAKYYLVRYIIEEVEPFFHKQQKPMTYRQEVEFSLFQMLMPTDLSYYFNIEIIFELIRETLQNEKYYAYETVDQLSRRHKTIYEEVIEKCVLFNDYKANKGRDIKQEKYRRAWQMKQQIYENNQNDRIDVSYKAIHQFVQKAIENIGKIPQVYPRIITDMSKLKQILIQPFLELPKQQEIIYQKDIPNYRQQLERKLKITFKKLLNYSENESYGFLDKIYRQNFGNNTLSMIKRIIETNAFKDENSVFFIEAGMNNLLTKRLNAQFLKISGQFIKQINQIQQILKQFGELQEKAPQNKPAQSLSKHVSDLFISQYIATYEESLLQKIWIQRYNRDSFKFVTSIISQNAFENSDSPFFASLGFNKLLTKRTKYEFQRDAQWALKKLDTLRQLTKDK